VDWIGLTRSVAGALQGIYRSSSRSAAALPEWSRSNAGVLRGLCRCSPGVLPACTGVVPGRLLRCFGCLERTWIAWSFCRLLECTWTQEFLRLGLKVERVTLNPMI
tara:strand:- start:1475 stop:1792 length:318 start_codon:yes stop_codon:yes gene_type:complete